MDDLNGLSWSPNSSNESKKPPPMSSSYLFPTVARSTTSGRSTPLSASGPSNPPSKSTTPVNDSFANLVSLGSSNSNKNLSLLEQQKRLQGERARKEAENRSKFEAQYGKQNAQFWDGLENGGYNNSSGLGASSATQRAPSPDEDDILAAFNASAPVDASTNFPIPSPSPQIGMSSSQSPSNGVSSMHQGNGMLLMDDDDPFGLDRLKSKPTVAPQPDQSDDFLGLLGKPVSELPRPVPPAKSPPTSEHETRMSPPKPSNGIDRAIAEIVDMGFPADKASRALRATASGTDVQAAVSFLLTQAHEESRQQSRSRPTDIDRHPDDLGRGGARSARPDRDIPSWMRDERPDMSRSRNDNRSPGSASRDASQAAAAFGSNFLKTANSLWKTGSKKVQQVVNDLNVEHDRSQPRWLREATSHQESRPHSDDHRAAVLPQKNHEALTDEAMLLEGGTAPRPSRNKVRTDDTFKPRAGTNDLRSHPSPAPEKRMQQPAFMQQKPRNEPINPVSRMSKTVLEEQSAQAYVSPARRKRPVAQPPNPEPSVDLFESSAPSPSVNRSRPSPSPAQPSKSSTPSTPLPVRPKASPRVIPQVSQDTLSSTHRHRGKGADAYKRGDFAAAHEAYTSALTLLPDKHPITIIIRSNRAMTALKIGEPKVAIGDADTILAIIGPSKGEAESIDLGNGEPTKPMRDFFGKALMRKAEALEQLERWADAAESWRLAVENGHGGSTSIQGRNRCEQAAGISKPPPKPPAPPKRSSPPAPKKPSASNGLQGRPAPSVGSSEAVSRLRAANQAAERADEEKFALGESVDARLAAWKSGKQDNLRALLASLDTVLWPEAGWKKINMSELILPNKVKVQYMKGIAKVHPDKISTDATTEQRMIAGAVFGALNEAWDKFKAENNL